MLKDITLGQYCPKDSVIHRMDARTKILLAIAYIVALFLVQNYLGFALIALALVGYVVLSRIPFSMILKSLKPLFFIVFLTAIINVFFTSGGETVTLWVLRISLDGLRNGIFMILRIVLLVAGTSMLTYTTSPILLTDGIERLLTPLKVFRFPVHDFAMMMSIAIRFIPTLIDETQKIMNAQKARGADFESGGLFKRAKALVPVLVPMFVSAFRRADDLALAMECRCYHGGEGRTKMTVTVMTLTDWLFLCGIAIVMTGVILLNGVML